MKRSTIFLLTFIFIITSSLTAFAGTSNKDYRQKISIPILLFHHISDEPGSELTTEIFKRYLREIRDNGYTTVFYKDLYNYTNAGTSLPLKPLVISFDDGYLSNYEIAYPILKDMGMKAEIAIIGQYMGASSHPKTGEAIIPHFSWQQAREMKISGVINIHSHSYDSHKLLNTDNFTREGILKKEFESRQSYLDALSTDSSHMSDIMKRELGEAPYIITYPFGKYDRFSEEFYSKQGYYVTVTTQNGFNTIEKGKSASLRLLNRICGDNLSPDTNIVHFFEKFNSNVL